MLLILNHPEHTVQFVIIHIMLVLVRIFWADGLDGQGGRALWPLKCLIMCIFWVSLEGRAWQLHECEINLEFTHHLPSHTTFPLTPPSLTHHLPSHTTFLHTPPSLTHHLPPHTTFPYTPPSLTHPLPSHTTFPHTPPFLTHHLSSHTT